MSSKRPFHWWSSPRTLIRQLLMLDDTVHSIALGAAVGMFVGMTPTVGLQMVLILLVALVARPLFRFNQVAGLIAVYISNPLTIIPIYWCDYKIGTLFFGGTVTRADFAAILQYEGLAQWWQTLVALFVDVGAPLVVGSLIVGTVVALLTYPATRWLLLTFREPRPPLFRAEQKEAVSSLAD